METEVRFDAPKNADCVLESPICVTPSGTANDVSALDWGYLIRVDLFLLYNTPPSATNEVLPSSTTNSSQLVRPTNTPSLSKASLARVNFFTAELEPNKLLAVSDLGNLNSIREVHPANIEESSILRCVPSAKFTLLSKVHPLKAYSAISLIELGIFTVTSFLQS